MRRIPILGLAALGLLILGLAAPSGASQAGDPPMLHMTIGSEKEREHARVDPGGHLSLRVTVVLTMPMLSTCNGPVTVHLEPVKRPPYATLQIKPSTLSFAPSTFRGGNSSSYMATVLVTVSIDRDAPAFQDGLYSIKAWGETSFIGCQAPMAMEQAFQLKNGFRPGLEAIPIVGRNLSQNGTVSMLVTNLANGPAKVHVDLEAAWLGRFLLLQAPEDARLGSRSYGPSASVSQRLDIAYALDKTVEAGPESFTALVTLSYDGASEGDLPTEAASLTFLVGGGETDSVLGDATLPFPGLATFAAVAVGVLRIRRQARS